MTALATRASSIIVPARSTGERRTYLRPVPTPSGQPSFAAELDRIGTVVNYPRDKTVLEGGTEFRHVFQVTSGMLRTVRLLSDGRRCITRFLRPGEFFGFGDGAISSYSVEALNDVTLVRYPAGAFAELLERNPAAARQFFRMICGELSAAHERLLAVGRKSALERMATFLMWLADGRPVTAGSGNPTINLAMSRGDIADHLGLTVETVSRVLALLRARRIIDVRNAADIVVLNRQALAAAAGRDLSEAR